MQNQQEADCKPKQSFEFYLTVIFMIAVPWNTLSVPYIGTCLYISFLIYFHEAPTGSKYDLY